MIHKTTMVYYSTLGIKKKVAGEEHYNIRREKKKKDTKPFPGECRCRETTEDYPERTLATRLAQPRWTTVLL